MSSPALAMSSTLVNPAHTTPYPPTIIPQPQTAPPIDWQQARQRVVAALPQDLDFALRFADLVLTSPLRTPAPRRRDTVNQRLIWRRRVERVGEALRQQSQNFVELERLGAISMDDLTALKDMAQAYAPGIFELMDAARESLVHLQQQIERQVVPTAQNIKTGVLEMVQKCTDLETIQEVTIDDLRALKRMARYYAPGVMGFFETALQKMKLMEVPPPPPPPMVVPWDDWGVRSLSDDGNPNDYVATSQFPDTYPRDAALAVAFRDVMPGLEHRVSAEAVER